MNESYPSENSNEIKIPENNKNTNLSVRSDVIDSIAIFFATMFVSSLFYILVCILIGLFWVTRKKSSRPSLSKKELDNKESCLILSKVSNENINNCVDVLENDKILIYNISSNQVVKDIEEKYLMSVKIEAFEKYTQTAFKAGALSAAFSIIKNVASKPCAYGSLTELKLKNRYANLFPCDDNRVILEKMSDDPYSDYINASFITGYGGIEKAYIATQGPTLHTVIDFWRMIWQEKVEIICMIVNLISNGRKKCEQYWPTNIGDKVLYGAISVKFLSEEVYLDFTYRKFLITCFVQEARTIRHLHFTAWPDHDVPSNARSIVNFLKKLHSLVPIPRTRLKSSIVVHSSGGIGRTGTLIVLDICLCRIFSEKVINVYEDVVSVRRERTNMISTVRQYLFIHLALVEYLNSIETCIPCDKKFSAAIKEAKKKSAYYYKRIIDNEWEAKVFDFWELSKNQTLTNRRLSFNEASNSYQAIININRIVKNRRYLAAKLPIPSTAQNFWKMIVEQNVNFILFLQLPSLELPAVNQFTSDNQFYVNTDQLKIIKQKDSKKIYDYYVKEEVLIVDTTKKSLFEKTVKIVMYNNWPENDPFPTPKELVKLWTEVEEILEKEEISSIALIDCDKVTATGLWLSLSFLLKNMMNFNECDVPYATSAIRKYNSNFLRTQIHIKYLFDVALVWSSSHKN